MPITPHQAELRRKHLGSSDAPAIVGLSPWRSRADVYWEKVGPLVHREGNEAMSTGRRLENTILDWAAEELGLQVRKNQFRVSKGEDGGILAASFDALGDGLAIEAKFSTVAEAWGPSGTDQVPEHVLVQVQHQMYVGGLEQVWVAAIIGGYSPSWRLYPIPRSEKIIAWLVEQEVQFWNEHVLPQVPPTEEPPPLWVLKALARDPEKVVPLDEFEQALVEEIDQLKAEKKRLEEKIALHERSLIQRLGDATEGLLPDGRVVRYREERAGRRINTAELKKRLPDVYEQFSTESTRRVLRVVKPRTKKEKTP